jgi:RNA polymerase sigma factor (sigma-70 family)
MVASIEPEIWAYLMVRIRDPDDRKEALADALAAGWESVGPESTVESLRSFAMGEARHGSARWKARQRHAETSGGRDLDLLQLDATSNASSPPETSARLELALAILRREERVALELWATENKSDHEIAAVLGCRQATVRKLRQRAKVRLRRMLSTSRPAGW